IISRESLAQQRPYIVVLCFVFGMLLTPPDMISQALLAIPTWMLFELGLFLSRFGETTGAERASA
ncbi:MAG: twin-arginine translocase subunit TatC, partial [Pseudomonadales bacterium]